MKKKQVQQEDLDALASIAHGINNQLTGVRGAAELLFEEASRKQKELLSQLLECTAKASKFVSEVQEKVYSMECEETESSDVIPLFQTEKSVLVVDDEAIVATVCADILKSVGFEVITASSGEEALRIFEKHHRTISMVLLDVQLPYTHGSLVFARMKAINPDIAVVAMSGLPREQAEVKFETGSLAGFVKKPFDAADLIKLTKAIAGNGQKQPKVSNL